MVVFKNENTLGFRHEKNATNDYAAKCWQNHSDIHVLDKLPLLLFWWKSNKILLQSGASKYINS
jgi:hypothetical protein